MKGNHWVMVDGVELNIFLKNGLRCFAILRVLLHLQKPMQKICLGAKTTERM